MRLSTGPIHYIELEGTNMTDVKSNVNSPEANADREVRLLPRMRVVETKIVDGERHIIVEGEVSALGEYEAKKLAYAERTKYGLDRAGIEQIGGITPVGTCDGKAIGRKTFCLRLSPV